MVTSTKVDTSFAFSNGTDSGYISSADKVSYVKGMQFVGAGYLNTQSMYYRNFLGKLDSPEETKAQIPCNDDLYGYVLRLTSGQSPNQTAPCIVIQFGEASDIKRVNTAALQELLQTYSTDYYSNPLNFSTATWSAFENAKKEAQSLLDSLYDEDGEPTDFNEAEKQPQVTAAEEALRSAAQALENRVNEYQRPNSDEALAGIELYLGRYDPEELKESDYTPDSWAAFLAAREAAQSVLDSSEGYYNGMGSSELSAQTEAFLKLRAACHGLVETKDSITVRFSVVENYAIRSEDRKPTQTVTRTLTLRPGTTIGWVMTEQGISNLDTMVDDAVAVYLNGILCYYVSNSGLSGGFSYSYSTQYSALGLHDGDELVIARIAPEPYMGISELTEYTSLDMVLELARHQKLTTSLTDGAVRAGEPFTVTVTAAKAMPAEYDGIYSPVEGASIYISASSEDQTAAEANQVNADTLAETGSGGQATVTLYEEGWCLLNAFDLSADGAYTNGGAVLIHVLPASNVDAVKQTLKQELLEAVQNADYPESYLKPADWAAIQAAGKAGTEAIDAAETTGTARAAQLEQLEKILALQASADEYNVSNLAYFRDLLEQLPDDLTKLDQSSGTTIKSLQSRYEDMTEYQLQRLTELEKDTYQEVVKRYSEGLVEAKAYQLRVEYDFSGVPESDQDALRAMITYLQENTATEGKRDVLGGHRLAKLYSFNTTRGENYGSYSFTELTSAAGGTKVTFCASPEYATHGLIRGNRATYDRNGGVYESQVTEADYLLAPEGAGWSVRDTSTAQVTDTTFSLNASRIYTVNGREYEMRGVTVSGLDDSDVTSATYGFFDFSDYLGKSGTNQTFISIADSFRNFTMPYEDVTFTVIWAPVGGTEAEIAAAKESAKASINSAYETYRQEDYTKDNWTLLTQAKDNGLQAVEAAKTLEEITDARKTAIAGMAIVPPREGSKPVDLPDMGSVVGRVYISVRNDTYPGGDFTGEILAGWYDLCEQDTMMTVTLKALKENGYAWSGTGGATSLDSQYDISYLGQIYRDDNDNEKWDSEEPQLGEFSGEKGSGWMGTLNDWFVNEGLNAFGVANKKLESNDEIGIVYTQNLGVDVGGTWNNADTSLKELTIQASGTEATLSPEFSGDTLEYVLTIPDSRANLTITPTATNKNYLVKTFLNLYNNDDVFYKRTETISVQPGDVIYIGVGEPSWPSMNNQGEEAIPYSATRYTIRVYSMDAKGIQQRIDALPDADKITLSGYAAYVDTVKALREDYNALENKDGVNIEKLTAVEEKISSLAAVDKVKKAIAGLPTVEEIKADPDAHRETVLKVEADYKALNVTQKVNFSSSETTRLNDALEALNAGGTTDEDLAAVQAFNALVAAIGETVTTESESAIKDARAKYNALTQAQKELAASAPEHYNTLCNAESALTVVKQIAAIGNVTLEKETDITEARNAYNSYVSRLDGQKDMVSNLSVLTEAEKVLEALKQGGGDTHEYQDILKRALSFLEKEVPNPGVGSTKGEWAVLAQARAGTLSEDSRLGYLENLKEYVEARDGKLDETPSQSKHTEYARVVVALTALGVDATQFKVDNGKTYNLVEPLLDKAAEGSNYAYQVSEQGNNGTIWALIALDSGGYYPDTTIRDDLINLLAEKQLPDGSWPIYNSDQSGEGSGDFATGSDIDVTAMAVQALAPYYNSNPTAKSTIDEALGWLSKKQNGTGGYGSSEASAQVIVALSALNRDAGTNEDFVKSTISVLADLLSYRVEESGGFRHLKDSDTNQMATEQAAYALVAYDRYKNGKKPLYDMSDVFGGPADDTDAEHTIHASAGTGGTISPVGDVTVPDEGDLSFTITPNDGYQIEDILVDGESVWAGGAAAAQKLEPPRNQLPAVPVEDVEPEACTDGIHVGETVVIGRRAATCTEPGYTGDVICGACGEVLEEGAETGMVPHQFGGAWQSDETGHWQICQVCGARSSTEPHVFEQAEEPAPQEPELPEQGDPEAEVPEQGGSAQEPDAGEEPTEPATGGEGTEEPGSETEEPDLEPDTGEEAEDPGSTPEETTGSGGEAEEPGAGEQQPEESEGQEPDTVPSEGEPDPEAPAPGEEAGEGSADGNEPPAEEEAGIPESTEAPAGSESKPEENTGSADEELVSVVGIHPMLLMSVGAGLPQMDGTAEPHAEGSACQVCGYSPETGGTTACSHSGGTATCTALAICELCGQPYGDYAQHTFTETAHSSGMHWNVCAVCGMEDLSSLAPHSWELDAVASTEAITVYVCPDCGAERTETTSAAPITAANALVTSADSRSYTYTFENVTEDHNISATFKELSPVIVQKVTTNGNTQTAVIDNTAVEEAVNAVKNSAADSITIIPTADSSSISSVSVELPAGAVQTISKANAGVEIQTSKGTVTLPANILSSIAAEEEAGGEKLSIHVEEKKSDTMEGLVPDGTDLTGSVSVEVTIQIGGSELTSFGGHYLTVTIPVDNSFTVGREYDVLVISDDGGTDTLTGICRASDGGRSVSVSVNHLSTFIVLAETTVETYTITATAGGNGDIDPFGSVEVEAGEDQIFRITPDDGYEIAALRVDGEAVDLDDLDIRSDGSASYIFYDVDANHSIRATFQRGAEIPDFGPVVGEVYISIENNTYRGGDFTGTLASGWYDLCAEDTMMTSVLKALALDGYSWWGTGASDTGGYDITYLSGIYVDENGNGRRDSSEPSLAEFDGSRGAGWMGTLNDWFVNEGFQSFRVGGRGAYELADGDYLNIVFTQNLGEDVGSLWGNSDTSLEDLRISGGTLTPRFDGDTLEYTLSITGNSARVTVTPTAVNKNYLVKTFLNHYNRDSAYYKRTQSITVKPGDVLYIGVGDPSWPSMNNQSTEAIDYEGTRYTITVVNGSSAEAVIEMIEALPEITYANYKAQASKVSAARAAYDALTTKAKAEISQSLLDKLEAAEAKIEFYEEIDAVKKLLKGLPAVNKSKDPTSSLIRQVKEAAAAYEDLNEEQKEYITSEDAERYEALRLWLIEAGAVGPNELPIIDGSLVMPELDGVEVVLEPKATVDSTGKAVASVTAAEFNTLLEEAMEAEATLIVIAPTGAARASSISVELPRRALDGALDETSADLAVRTPLGELSMPNLTLAGILSGAGGQDLTVNMARRTISQAEALLNGRADVTEEQMSGASAVEVTITSGSKSITSFSGRSITLLLPVDAGAFQAGQSCAVYQISEGGALETHTGICRSVNGSLWVEITTTHLSTFVVVPPEKPVQLPFTDVREGDWFYDAVAYAYTNGLFNGTSATTFSPNGTMTRSMLVTVLWRMEDEPTANSANPFADVAAGTWYTDAVVWASSAGIVNGTSATTFDPDGTVTREQIAAILYRYAKTKGWDISGASSLSSFTDGPQVSDWAARAMEWAYAEGLITGKDGGRLDPQGQASRAEVATILMRLLESRS